MRKFNPVEYMRDTWGDQNHTKNRPKQCSSDHHYCHLPYEWGVEAAHASVIGCLQGDAGLGLPEGAQQGPTINYDLMTEQNLDDWYAQSINRSIPSMLNPQKKFYLPPNYEQELRSRYPQRPGERTFEDDPYFKLDRPPARKKTPSYMGKEEKRKNLSSEVACNFRLLQPRALLGTPIRLREPQDLIKPAARRRNAVLLLKDIHYGRLLKKLAKPEKEEEAEQRETGERRGEGQREMLYSFNLESMDRKNCEQDVPNSIIEREYQRIRQPQPDFISANRNHLRRQEDIQEKTRTAINQRAGQAVNQIEALVRKDTTEQKPREPKGRTRAATVGRGRTGTVSGVGAATGVEEKVLNLLNKMQVVSQHIDVEMANLNIHLPEITVRHASTSIQHKWILKAEQKLREHEHVLAIDCYKQALILQPDSFIPIYNIAVLLEKEKMLTYAKEWFLLAKQKETDAEKVSFGLALVQVKQLNFEGALREIDELILKLEKADPRRKIDMTYYYLRALCYKKLEQFDRAKTDYELIIRHSKPANYNSLSYFLLSVVFAKSRRYLKMKFDCLSFMNWRQTLHLLFYEKGKRVREEGMNNTDLAERLLRLPFFCRFSKNLLRRLLDNAAYEFMKKDTIIFAAERESLIVVSGLVSVWSHQDSITTPETVSVLGQGGIVGGGDVDHHLSARPNYWFLAKTDLELIRISRQQFSLFWQGQVTFEWDYKYNFLKNVGLFKGLPEATLFRLCEHVQEKTYSYGEILFNDCSYRYQVVSKEGMGFCLAKNVVADRRFVGSKKSKEEQMGRRRDRYRLCTLLRKHKFRFNEMKFNRLRYSGLFVVLEGQIQLQDDRGFRCIDLLTPRDYFGQNLLIHSQGFHNYGRLKVHSATARCYHIPADKLLWTFTSLDKATMTVNASNRKEIETLRFLRNRFNECLEVKMAKLVAKRD